MDLQILNTKNAFKLYGLLQKHLPKDKDDALDFVTEIIDSIIVSGEHRAYIEALQTLNPEFDIEKQDPKAAVNLLIAGLSINKIMSLDSFISTVGKDG